MNKEQAERWAHGILQQEGWKQEAKEYGTKAVMYLGKLTGQVHSEQGARWMWSLMSPYQRMVTLKMYEWMKEDE